MTEIESSPTPMKSTSTPAVASDEHNKPEDKIVEEKEEECGEGIL
jgi:hypothetical protein